METLKEKVKNKLKEKGRRKVKRTEKVKNQILRELYNNYLEKGEGLNISELKKLIPLSHYSDVHRAVDELELFSNAVKSTMMPGKVVERKIQLNPIWIKPIKENYEKNNGQITIFFTIVYRISFLEFKSYLNQLFTNYPSNTKIKFFFFENIEDLKNNDKLSELKEIDRELIHRYMAENMTGFTIESLKDPDTLDLIIHMGKRKLLEKYDFVYD